MLCLFLFGGNRLGDPHLAIGQISCLWAGLGSVIGHNWPCWRHFSGGKGVAVTCMAIFLFSPLWGLLADLAGMLTVMATGYLPLGAVVITIVYALLTFFFVSTESFLLALILMILMFSRHWKGLVGMVRGKEERYCQVFKRRKPDEDEAADPA